MVKIINEDLRSSLKGFLSGIGDSILGNTDTMKEFFELLASIAENNDKLKEICNKQEFKSNKYFKDIYNEAKKLYDGTSKCVDNITKSVTKAEEQVKTDSESESEELEDSLKDIVDASEA